MNAINKILISGIVLTGLFSCTKNFEDINTNPNRPEVDDISAYGMFEPLLYNGTNEWLNNTWFWNDELIQFTAFTGGTTRQEHQYFISDGNWQSTWNLFAGYANNADHMYDLAVEQNELALQAIALTFKVLYMSNLTDMYGDIPYAEAFTGRKPGGTTKPAFNSQKEVYQLMFADLEKANDIYAQNPEFQKGTERDRMYKGDMKQWRKFNNSLYLRLLSRISGRTEMNAGSKMTEIITNTAKYPVFISNDDNATVKYETNDPYKNRFESTTESGFTSSGRKMTQQFVKMTVITENGVQTYQDPRLPVWGKKNTSTQTNPNNIWIGTVAGCTDEERTVVDRGTSWLNAAVFCRADAPGFLMDFSEIQFILADAAQKGYITGGEAKAKEYYTSAVTASMQKWATQGKFSETPVVIADGDITAFLASDLASWDKAADKEELIANQKFLSLFWVGMEAYHEYRRTGYPVLTIGKGALNDGILPTRFAYPNDTMTTNEENARKALNNMGATANDMKTPVWWSKQAIQSGK